MSEWQLWVADALVLLGSLGSTLTVVAILRTRSVRAKIQAGATAPVVGASLVLAACFVTGEGAFVARALVAAVLLVVGSALAAHALMALAREDAVDARSD